jgi:hypothetical protein
LRAASALAESMIWRSVWSADFQAFDEGVLTTVSLADWHDGVERGPVAQPRGARFSVQCRHSCRHLADVDKSVDAAR